MRLNILNSLDITHGKDTVLTCWLKSMFLILIIFATEDVLLPPLVCLSICRFTQNVVNDFLSLLFGKLGLQ